MKTSTPIVEKVIKVADALKLPLTPQSVTAFLADVDSEAYRNPFNPRERVWQDRFAVELSFFNGRIHISSVRSFENGKGDGSAGLQWLCSLADRHGITMDCDPVPFGSKALSRAKLIAWYKRYGFRNVPGEGFVRKPNATKAARLLIRQAAERWFHGTSHEHAQSISESGELRPGMESSYGADLEPRPDAVYITTSLKMAQGYANDTGVDGVVFEVDVPAGARLIPDEDAIKEALVDGSIVGGIDPEVVTRIEKSWMKWFGHNNKGSDYPDTVDFSEAWSSFEQSLDDHEMAEHVRSIADRIAKSQPKLAKRIIEESRRAAHIGAVKIKSIVTGKIATAPPTINTASNLRAKLEAARPGIAAVAQQVYDAWDQDEDGIDAELGTGGICDEIAQEVANYLSDIDTTEGGQDGDDHAFLIAYDDTEAYEVDIPPGVYETGGGYSWKKRPNVIITADDVYIGKIDRSILDDFLDNEQ